MVTRINNFINILPKFGSEGPSERKQVSKDHWKEAYSKIKPEKIKEYLSDPSLSVSLRRFSNQIGNYSSDILNSPLPNKEKIAAIKVALFQLENAVQGRRELLEGVTVMQKRELLLLHGKTLKGLEKNVQGAEQQIAKLRTQLEELERKELTKGKLLPLPSAKFKFTANSFAAYLLDPRVAKERDQLVPLFPSVFGVKQSAAALTDALEKKIANASNKPEARREALAVATRFLKSIPPHEFNKADQKGVLFNLITSLNDSVDPRVNPLLSVWNDIITTAQVKGSIITPDRPVTSLERKLVALAQEKDPKKYQKLLTEVSTVLHEDSLEILAALPDYDVFNPDKSKAGGGDLIKGIEDTLKLFLMAEVTPKERSRRVEVLLDIIKKNTDNNNYLIGLVIHGVLNSRVAFTKISVSKPYQKIQSQLEILGDPIKIRQFLGKQDPTQTISMPTFNLGLVTATHDMAKGDKTLGNLRKLAKAWGMHFQARTTARSLKEGLTNPYTFLDPTRSATVREESKLTATKLGYHGGDNLEEIQEFLYARVRKETTQGSGVKAEP